MPRPTLAALLLAAALPLSVAASQTPKTTPAATAAPTTIRTGTYDLDIVFGGGTLPGTLDLTPSGDSLTAKLHVGDHEAPVKSLTRKGAHLTINGGGEGMKVVYELNFDGDGLSGTFTFNDNPGIVTGKRRTTQSGR